MRVANKFIVAAWLAVSVAGAAETKLEGVLMGGYTAYLSEFKADAGCPQGVFRQRIWALRQGQHRPPSGARDGVDGV